MKTPIQHYRAVTMLCGSLTQSAFSGLFPSSEKTRRFGSRLCFRFQGKKHLTLRTS